MKIACNRCDKAVEIKKSNSIGDMAKESGYYCVFAMDGNLWWYCTKCWPEIYDLASKLKEKLKAEYICVDHLLFEKMKPKET
jgi:hypothetical protein